MNLLIMGGPGAGKGTMSEKILEKYGIVHISTGDIFREEMASGSKLGQLAKSYIDEGRLVPDSVTDKMVRYFFERTDCSKGYLLDGYPRTLAQAQAFDEFTQGTDLEIQKVVVLDIEFEALKERITGRRICKNCKAIYHVHSHPSKTEGICDVCGGELYQRKDDTVESLTVRLEEYVKMTQPVLEYYQAKGILVHVNANQDIHGVWNDTQKALED